MCRSKTSFSTLLLHDSSSCFPHQCEENNTFFKKIKLYSISAVLGSRKLFILLLKHLWQSVVNQFSSFHWESHLLLILASKTSKCVSSIWMLGSSLKLKTQAIQWSELWHIEKLIHFSFTGLIPYWPTTVGSKSTIIARGTYLLMLVSLKNVAKESSLLGGSLKVPSGWMLCSRQKSSQHALPIWTPAWPMWTEMHSRWSRRTREMCEKKQLMS